MKVSTDNKDILTVEETINHFQLSRRKFYPLLKEEGLDFFAFYYGGRRLILKEPFARYLLQHPELKRR